MHGSTARVSLVNPMYYAVLSLCPCYCYILNDITNNQPAMKKNLQ